MGEIAENFFRQVREHFAFLVNEYGFSAEPNYERRMFQQAPYRRGDLLISVESERYSQMYVAVEFGTVRVQLEGVLLYLKVEDRFTKPIGATNLDQLKTVLSHWALLLKEHGQKLLKDDGDIGEWLREVHRWNQSRWCDEPGT